MKKLIIIILLLASVCFGDTYTSHQKPNTDSLLDIGTSSLFWRSIYGDSFTDGTALWNLNSLSGFTNISGTTLTDGTFIITGGVVTAGIWNGDAIDISDYTNLVAGTNITLSNDTLNVDIVFYTWHFDLSADLMPVFDIRGDESDYWEVNSSDYSEMMPVTGSGTSAGWELDGNDDLMPQA